MLIDKIYHIIDKLLRAVYPKHCPICDEIIPINEDYCKCSRYDSRKISDDYCRHCGLDSYKCSCSSENSVYLPDIAGVYIYNGKIRSDILSLKFNYEKRIAKRLGEDMAERCAKVYCDTDFDIVSFIPMSESSFRKRTYNQSQLLAEVVGKKFFVETMPLFSKTIDTAAQHNLSGKDRINNLKDSMVLNSDVSVQGKNILLCDDVKTTGATLSQCVNLLEQAGANKVCCICVALSDFNR